MSNTQSVALYRKYRGLSFDDIVGQDHITGVLKSSIKNNRISHAYLFTGPRGVGKTSVARILAHEINGLDYKHEENHIDIIEIDAASNRRIDEIRDLREKSHISPISAKYKVYIIDEVHMLTTEAFNALLKTLEEPPAHVVFILATTEAHKLPQTIISRTQRHTFKPCDIDTGSKHLRHIAELEGIDITDEALRLIAKHGDGSFRDAIGLLDQVSSGKGPVQADDVRATLGLIDESEVSELLEAALSGNQSQVVNDMRKMFEAGIQPELLSAQLVELLKDSDAYYDQLDLAERLVDVPSHPQPAIMLEIVLLKSTAPQTVQKHNQKDPSVSKSLKTKPLPKPKEEPTTQALEPKEVDQKPNHVRAAAPLSQQAWEQVILAIKSQNNAIASILRAAPPQFSESKVTIVVHFDFHKKKLEDTSTTEMIRDAMVATVGGIVDFDVIVDANAVRTETENQQPQGASSDELADSIINTFGGGERVSL